MLGPDSRCVAPVFHQVGFVRNLVTAGSVGFVEDAVEHVGLIFFAKKAGAQWFVVDARVSNRRSLRPPPGPLLTGEELCHVEFQGAPEDAQNWLVGSADIENAFHQMGIPWWLQAFFALPAVLASEVGYTGKTIDRRRRAPDSLKNPVPATLPMGLSWAMFFCQGVTDHCAFAGSADSPLFVCGNHHRIRWHRIRWLPLVVS